MAYSMVGYKLSFTSGSGAQAIAGPNGSGGDGPIDVLIKANNAGVYIGNADVNANLPTTGYELTSGQEYKFTFHGDGAYIATTSGSTVTAQIFVSPHVA